MTWSIKNAWNVQFNSITRYGVFECAVINRSTVSHFQSANESCCFCSVFLVNFDFWMHTHTAIRLMDEIVYFGDCSNRLVHTAMKSRRRISHTIFHVIKFSLSLSCGCLRVYSRLHNKRPKIYDNFSTGCFFFIHSSIRSFISFSYSCECGAIKRKFSQPI